MSRRTTSMEYAGDIAKRVFRGYDAYMLCGSPLSVHIYIGDLGRCIRYTIKELRILDRSEKKDGKVDPELLISTGKEFDTWTAGKILNAPKVADYAVKRKK